MKCKGVKGVEVVKVAAEIVLPLLPLLPLDGENEIFKNDNASFAKSENPISQN